MFPSSHFHFSQLKLSKLYFLINGGSQFYTGTLFPKFHATEEIALKIDNHTFNQHVKAANKYTTSYLRQLRQLGHLTSSTEYVSMYPKPVFQL